MMTDKRLEEIKHSIELQEIATKMYGYDETLISEEKELLDEVIRLRAEVKLLNDNRIYLNNRIDKAINKIQYIGDIGFDYDGYNDVDSLKMLIDELVDIAGQSIDILRGNDE